MMLLRILCMVGMAVALPARWNPTPLPTWDEITEPSELKRPVAEPPSNAEIARAVRSPEDTEERQHEENADAHEPPADLLVDPPSPQLNSESSSGSSNPFIGWIPVSLQPYLSGLQSVPGTIQSQISSIPGGIQSQISSMPGNIQSSISSIPGLSSLQSSMPSLPGLSSLPSLSSIQSQLPFSIPSLQSIQFMPSWLGGGSSVKYLVPITRSPFYVYAAYPV